MNPPAEFDDPVSYQFYAGRETWTAWKNTIPRDTPLDARLRTLIQQDLRAAQRDADATETQTVNVLASRIRIRSMQAIDALRGEDTDADAAIEQLEDISDIADALES